MLEALGLNLSTENLKKKKRMCKEKDAGVSLKETLTEQSYDLWRTRPWLSTGQSQPFMT